MPVTKTRSDTLDLLDAPYRKEQVNSYDPGVDRWLLLDRDGTICKRHHYLTSIEQLDILPGVAEALALATKANFRIVILTNQSVVGRGLLSQTGLEQIHNELVRQLAVFGATVDSIYACLHTPADQCLCRKPQIGMFTQFARDYIVTPDRCVFIGDAPSDIAAGRRWGCRTIAINGPLFRNAPASDVVSKSPSEAVLRAIDLLRSNTFL